jgi:hypothetical protein
MDDARKHPRVEAHRASSGRAVRTTRTKELAMRWVVMVAFALVTVPLRAQDAALLNNSACEAACKTKLDRCSATSNKVMETALKESSVYTIDTADRARADTKFEGAFLAGEKCWDGYYRCSATCQPPKRCLNACRSTFKRCFAVGERKMRQGLVAMRGLPFNSSEWQAAYTQGDGDVNRCLLEIRDCQAKCANP